MFVVTVDRDGIDKGATAPIRVEHPSGNVTTHARVRLLGDVVILSGPPRQDGARVWIEAERIAL